MAKKITCDICGIDFGKQVNHFTGSMFSPSQFNDSGFYAQMKDTSDICNGCFNEITVAQNQAIKRIKDSLTSDK